MCQVDQRVRLSGGAKICEMTISGVVPEDAGAYRCVLADREDIVTVARNIDISVGVAAVEVRIMERDAIIAIRHFECL